MPALSDTPITLILIIANLICSLYAMYQNPGLLDRWSIEPRRIIDRNEWYRLLTAGFIHTGGAHLAFNMITLYFFGPILENILGPLKFLILYFGAELAAHGLTIARHSSTPGYAAVGASGAISGVVFGFCLFYPWQNIYLMLIPVGIPAIGFAVGYVVLSIWAARREGGTGLLGRIAHEAHVGGALGGLVLTILLEPRALGAFLDQLGIAI